ncbi:hypothetical protein AVM02_10485 [Brucella anthropi]|uniref:Bug family tripartite tricarboxylate transporter substrate binding protein n=1 Tax=Brucella anthropi TaxID=529 RepID=UPI003985F532
MKHIMMRIAVAISALAGAIAPNAAMANGGAEFFNGKTITYIVATSPGGVYDTNGRLIAQYMQKYLPGSTIIVQNMPGAGHLIGANYISASKPDGLIFGTFNTGLIYQQLIKDPGVRFDLGKMSWIGKATADPRVIIVSTESGIENFDQLQALKQPIKFSAPGKGTASMMETTMLVKTLKLPVEIVSGYNGNEDQLAMLRGETQGVLGSRSEWQPLVNEGKARIIAQIGGTQTDVPQLSSLISDPAGQAVVKLIGSQSNLTSLTAGPADIAADQLGALREAYRAATEDPDYRAKAKTLGLPVAPLIGDDVARLVQTALSADAQTVDILKETQANE